MILRRLLHRDIRSAKQFALHGFLDPKQWHVVFLGKLAIADLAIHVMQIV